MNLTGMVISDNQRTVKMTVLHRPGKTWHDSEVGRIVNGLSTEASQHPKWPEYVILFGHYTKDEVLKALIGGMAFTVTQATGIHDSKLPFNPGFV